MHIDCARDEGCHCFNCGACLNDVTPYYYDAVLWAAENGITGGVDDTHFAPNATCTRAQIVTFIYRALADK